MKTKIYTLIALLTLTAGSIFATEATHGFIPGISIVADGTDAKVSPDAIISKLAPVTPKDADFEDPEPVLQISIGAIAPITPKETDFEEVDSVPSVVLPILAPVTPAEADFVL